MSGEERLQLESALERVLEVIPERTLRALALLRHVDEDVREHAIAMLPLGSRIALAAFEAVEIDDAAADPPTLRIMPLGHALIEASGELYPEETLQIDPRTWPGQRSPFLFPA